MVGRQAGTNKHFLHFQVGYQSFADFLREILVTCLFPYIPCASQVASDFLRRDSTPQKMACSLGCQSNREATASDVGHSMSVSSVHQKNPSKLGKHHNPMKKNTIFNILKAWNIFDPLNFLTSLFQKGWPFVSCSHTTSKHGWVYTDHLASAQPPTSCSFASHLLEKMAINCSFAHHFSHQPVILFPLHWSLRYPPWN